MAARDQRLTARLTTHGRGVIDGLITEFHASESTVVRAMLSVAGQHLDEVRERIQLLQEAGR